MAAEGGACVWSSGGDGMCHVRFLNRTPVPLKLQWVRNEAGETKDYEVIEPGSHARQRTYATHPFRLVLPDSGLIVAEVVSVGQDQDIEVACDSAPGPGTSVRVTVRMDLGCAPCGADPVVLGKAFASSATLPLRVDTARAAGHAIQLYWVKPDGGRQLYDTHSVSTYECHPWEFREASTGVTVAGIVPRLGLEPVAFVHDTSVSGHKSRRKKNNSDGSSDEEVKDNDVARVSHTGSGGAV